MSTITAPSPTSPGPQRATAARRGFVAVLLVLIVGASALLANAGCARMREVAPVGHTDAYGRTVAGHSWSLRPAGFTVRYDDGTSTTQLWW